MSMMPSSNFAVADLATRDLAAPNLAIDTGGVEKRLNSINNATALWALPALPDNVKLDLSMYSAFESMPVSDFLNGIASDIAQQTTQKIAPPVDTTALTTASPFQVTAAVNQPQMPSAGNMLFAPDDDFTATFQKTFTKLAGISGPKRIGEDSVISLKAQAIKRGIIPSDTKLDGSWGRQWNGVRSELIQDQFRDVLSGDRPGGLPVSGDGGLMGLLDKWASPTGLIGLATQLDFMFDPKAIARETSDWGDKWRKWWKNKTSVRDFTDAMTGPIDDVAFPIINTALLLSGVGGIVTYGRALSIGARGLEVAAQGGLAMRAGVGSQIVNAFGGLRPGSVALSRGERVLGLGVKAFDVNREVKTMQEASMIATRLRKVGGVGGVAGDALAAWRQQSAVVMTKKVVQSGMKLGFAGRVEEFLLPQRELGFGLGGQTGGTTSERAATFEEWHSRKIDNPWAMAAWSVAEVALTPTNVFKQGSIIGPLKNSANRFTDALVGTLNERHAVTGFITAAAMQMEATDPQGAKKVLQEVIAGKGREQLVKVYGQGDEIKASKVMNTLMYNAALRSYARNEALVVTGTTSGEKFDRVYNAFRNQAINQVRGADFDLDTEWGRDAYRAFASKIAAADEAPKAAAARRKKLWDHMAVIHDDTPEGLAMRAQAKLDLEHHGKVRSGAFKDLLEGVRPEDIAEEVGNAWPTLSNWDNYESGLRQLEHDTAFTVNGEHTLRSIQDLTTGDFAHPSLIGDIGDMILGQTYTGKQLEWFDKTKVQMAEGRGRLTLERLDGVTANTAEAYMTQIKWLQDRQRMLKPLAETGLPEPTERWGQSLADYAAKINKKVSDLDANDVKAWVSKGYAQAGRGRGSAAIEWANTVTWASRNGVDHMDAHGFVSRKLDELANSEDFWQRSGISKWAGDRQLTFDEKIKLLERRIEFMAKDVKVSPELEETLRKLGYKAVFGTEFSLPSDVLDLAGPIPELKRLDMVRNSLGTFIGHDRQAVELQKDLRSARFKRLLPAAFEELRNNGVDLGPRGMSTEDVDFDQLLGDLHKGRRTILETNNMNARLNDQAGFLTNVFGRLTLTGMPRSVYALKTKEVQNILGEGFSKAGIDAIIGALERANSTGFENRGLLSIEDAFVNNSWLRTGLKSLAGHPVNTDFDEWAKSATGAFGPGPIRNYTASIAHPLEAIRAAGVYDQKRLLTALAGAGVGLYTNEQSGGAVNPLQAAAVGAVTGAVTGPRIMNPRNVVRAYAALTARDAAMAAGVEDQGQRVGIAVLGGLVGGKLATTAAKQSIHWLDNRGWAQYSKVGRVARSTRDRLRFSLNPIWDAQRYTEGLTQAVVADLPHGVTLPVTLNPMRRLLKEGEVTFNDGAGGILRGKEAAIANWKEASRGGAGSWDHDTLDSMQDWFTERGIMGYSPTDWHAASFNQLTRQGMAPADAVKAVEKIYMTGLRRTGLEASVNFVFFPFSFQKHLLGNMAKFASQDLGRLTLMHDGVKMWDDLNERYDLPQMWRDHLPFLSELRKFNPLAYGLSAGEFGGINRANYEALKRLPVINEAHDAVANAFLPQAWHVSTQNGLDPKNWDSYKGKVQRLLPIWREAEDMLQDVIKEQANVMASDTHLSKQSEIDRGWEEHGKLNDGINQMLEANGLKYSSVMAATPDKPLYQVKQYIVDARYQLENKYPAWRADKATSTERAIERSAELRKTILAPGDDPVARAVGVFDGQLDALTAALGFNVQTDTEQLTTEQFDIIRRTAIGLARTVPGFQTSYRVYYQRLFGPIEKELR